MIRKIYISILFSIGFSYIGVSQEAWTVGPMMHVNFGGERIKVSYALECAYWNYKNFIYSIDGGLEFESGRFRMYSEFQTGIGLAGASCGPVLEFNSDEGRAHFGFQGSLWANYYLGFDFRLRRINKATFKCPGVYAKLPFVPGRSNGSNGNSRHVDWD